MARIFIAIRFDDEFKQELVGLPNAFQTRGVAGNYCPYGNPPLTLALIGEKYPSPEIRKAVNEVTFEPFTITLENLGMFPTKAGVIWCGIKEQEQTTTLADRLRDSLTAHGVLYNTQRFVPHISLVQHPSRIVTDIEVPKVSTRIERIYVMKSERINGELIYSEV